MKKISKDNEEDFGSNTNLDTRYEFRKGFIDAQSPNTGQHFKGVIDPLEPNNYSLGANLYNRSSVITRINGKEAYSQQASLYKGVSKLDEFWPQIGQDSRNGKIPKGKYHPEPHRPKVERNKRGFKPQGPYKEMDKTPLVSPLPSNVEDTTTNKQAIHTTVRDLKYKLNAGMGSRTNKYVLELDIPVPHNQPYNTHQVSRELVPDVKTLNILCQSTSFPQRQMNVASLWRFGRKYNLRGETNFGDTWTLEFVDDSVLSIRRALDRWFIDIDDSKLQDTALNGLYRPPKSKLQARNLTGREFRDKLDWTNAAKRYASGFNKEYEASLPNYQTDIRVFQIDQVGNKTYGYLLQNAFISEISAIDYKDDLENQLTKFSVTLSFSEFVPLGPDQGTLFQDILT